MSNLWNSSFWVPIVEENKDEDEEGLLLVLLRKRFFDYDEDFMWGTLCLWISGRFKIEFGVVVESKVVRNGYSFCKDFFREFIT